MSAVRFRSSAFSIPFSMQYDYNPRKIRYVIVDISFHLVITSVLSICLFLQYRKISYVILCFAGGVLIDLDHLLDYFLHYGFRFNVKEFLSVAFVRSGRVYVFLHSWELLVLILAIGFALSNPYLLALSYAIGLHLLVDNIKRRNKLFYFLVYRIKKSFQVRELLFGEPI